MNSLVRKDLPFSCGQHLSQDAFGVIKHARMCVAAQQIQDLSSSVPLALLQANPKAPGVCNLVLVLFLAFACSFFDVACFAFSFNLLNHHLPKHAAHPSVPCGILCVQVATLWLERHKSHNLIPSAMMRAQVLHAVPAGQH